MSEYRRGTRVVVTEELPGVPEGTPGKCGRGLGFALKRYRVRFDNGAEAISVAHNKLVPEREWPQYLAKRARAEIEAAQARALAAETRAAAAEARGLPAASTAEPALTPDAAATSESTSTSKPGTEAAETSDGPAGADPRLAALMARSKSARDATGVPAPEPDSKPTASTAASADETETATGTEDLAAASAKSAASSTAPSTAKPARSAPPSGPERPEFPEFVPGPAVEPDYAPKANRVSELLEQVRNKS